MAREAEASSEAAAGPSLLHLPANCLERVAELVLFCDEDGATHLPQLPACTDSGAHFRLPLDATAGPLLACKALWRAAEAVLHHCLHVGVLYGGLFPPFEQQLQGTVQQLVLATLERWAAHARFDQQLEIAAARSPHLRHLSIHHGLTRAGQWPRVGPWPAQLLHFTALESLTFSPLEATVDGGSFNPDSWPALPGTLRRLTLCVGPVTDSLLDSLAALSRLSSLELYCRTFEADAGSMPLSRLPLCTLRIEVSSSAQPQHVLELPQLNVDLQELFVTGPSLQDFYEPSDFLLADSGAWLGMSRLRRLTLARFQLEAPPDRLQFPALESLHLAQCYSDWLERPVLSRLSRLTALVLQHCGFLFCDLSPVTPLRKLCVTAEGHILLPTGVPQLSHLTALDLSWNELESLPAGPYLSSLRHLNISYNKFSSLPPVLAAATALEVLDVTGCSELRAYNACVLARMPALVTVHLKQLEPYDEYEADEEQRLWQLSQLKYEIRLATELQADLRRRRASQPPLLDTTSRLVIASLLFPEGEIRIRREAGW